MNDPVTRACQHHLCASLCAFCFACVFVCVVTPWRCICACLRICAAIHARCLSGRVRKQLAKLALCLCVCLCVCVSLPRCDVFSVLDTPDGLQFSVRDLLNAALHVVTRSTHTTHTAQPTSNPSPASFVRGVFDLATIEAMMSAAPAPAAAAAPTRAAPPAPQGVVALFLPRNSDLRELASLVPHGHVSAGFAYMVQAQASLWSMHVEVCYRGAGR